MIFVLGGWDANLKYLSGIVKFDVSSSGGLTKDDTFRLV